MCCIGAKVWTPDALTLLCKKAAGGKLGARDLRRVIRKEVEDRLAAHIIGGTAAAQMQVTADDEEIAVTQVAPKAVPRGTLTGPQQVIESGIEGERAGHLTPEK